MSLIRAFVRKLDDADGTGLPVTEEDIDYGVFRLSMIPAIVYTVAEVCMTYDRSLWKTTGINSDTLEYRTLQT